MSDERRDPDANPILEKNLESLLRRAYSPALPRPEFRAALRARVLLARGFVVERAPRRRLRPLFVAATIFTFACGFAAVAGYLATRSDAPPSGERRVEEPTNDESAVATPTGPDSVTSSERESSAPRTRASTSESADPATPPTPASPSVRGTVAAYGRPLASFRVSFVRYERSPGQPDYSVTSLEFDTEEPEIGRFRVDSPLVGRLRVFVEADDHAIAASEPFWLLPGDPEKDLAFELVAGATVRGRVIDAKTGAPLRNALVFSENEFAHPAIPWSELALVAFSGLPPRGVRTDEAGRFELEHVSPRHTVLRAKAIGSVPLWRKIEAVDRGTVEDVVFETMPGATMDGTTRDDAGAPVEGAVIVAVNQTLGAPTFDQPMAVGYSDADGRFDILDLPAGVYSVLDLGPRAARFDADRIRIVEVGLAGNTTIEFGPPRGDAAIAGVLLDPTGNPVAGATLSFAPQDGIGSNLSSWRSAFTAADGSFALDRLAPGRTDVFRVYGATGVLAIGTVDLVAGARTEVELRESGFALSGVVVDGVDGSPLPGAFLVLEWLDPASGRGSFAGRSPVEPDGSFHLEHLRPGAYRIGAVALDGIHGAITTDPIAADANSRLRLLLPRGASAILEFAGDGSGLPKFAVCDLAGGDLTGLLLIQTHGERGVRIEGLPVGEVIVSVFDEGFAPLEQRIRIDEGRETRATIELARPH